MSQLHPEQADPSHAETAFAFLLDQGFRLDERLVTEGQSYRDGWRLGYAGGEVRVVVQYLDMQFEVFFERAGVRTDYLFVDRERFHQRSGLHGNMFTPQNLGPIVDRVAADIRDHYGPLLQGDESEWARIERLTRAPKEKRLP